MQPNDINEPTSAARPRAPDLRPAARPDANPRAARPLLAETPRRPDPGKNNDGPPDLDEMWRDFNRHLSALFGGRRPGDPPLDPKHKRTTRIGFGVLIGAAIALYLGSGLFLVPDEQTGIVTHLGHYRTSVGPGVHWREPLPFEAETIVDTGALRTLDFGTDDPDAPSGTDGGAVLTKDGDILNVRYTVQYHVSSATDFLFHADDPLLLLAQAARATVRAQLGALDASQVRDLYHAAFEARVARGMQAILDRAGVGLTVTGVTLQGVDMPTQVRAAANDVDRAQQEMAAAMQSAQDEANNQLAAVRADAASQAAAASAYAQHRISAAQDQAERFTQAYNEYVKAPALVREHMYLDTMQAIYSAATKVYVDGKTAGMVYLPIDKLVAANRAAAASDAAAAASAASAVAAPPAVVSTGASEPDSSAASDNDDAERSRDSLRSRDRDDGMQ
jgi:modulator of FtsH protease HflK